MNDANERGTCDTAHRICKKQRTMEGKLWTRISFQNGGINGAIVVRWRARELARAFLEEERKQQGLEIASLRLDVSVNL